MVKKYGAAFVDMEENGDSFYKSTINTSSGK